MTRPFLVWTHPRGEWDVWLRVGLGWVALKFFLRSFSDDVLFVEPKAGHAVSCCRQGCFWLGSVGDCRLAEVARQTFFCPGLVGSPVRGFVRNS